MLTAEATATLAPVLVVDDDADLRDLIGRVLDGIGVAHLAVESGEAARRAVGAGMPRLFVLDVKMPGISGLELCREVKDRAGDDVAVLLVSAESSPEDIAAGFAAGADDYLVKPFRTGELAERARRLLARPEAVSA